MPDDKDDDDLYDAVAAMADRLDLQGRERSQYIHEHMTRGGYRAVPNYVREEEEEEEDKGRNRGSAFFSGRDREERRPRGRDDRRSRDRGDAWYE